MRWTCIIIFIRLFKIVMRGGPRTTFLWRLPKRVSERLYFTRLFSIKNIIYINLTFNLYDEIDLTFIFVLRFIIYILFFKWKILFINANIIYTSL